MENSHNNPNQTVRSGSGKIIGDFISGNTVFNRDNNINGDWVMGDKVMGNKTINNYNKSIDLAEAAKDIQDLIDRLAITYPTETRSAKNGFADEIVNQIEANPSIGGRLLSATKAGGVAAIEEFLSHPAVSFIVAAIEDWEKTKR